MYGGSNPPGTSKRRLCDAFFTMADNYLEKRQEAYMAQSSKLLRRTQNNLRQLLKKNRSHRGYDAGFIVRADQLRRIIEVNTLIPSAHNRQVLRFRPVLCDEAAKVLPHIRLGGALPDIHLPKQGMEPNAFIVVCSVVPETRNVSIDLGISLQSMLLQAVEMGLNGICVGAFDKKAVVRELKLRYEPLIVLAIGRGAEKIEIVNIKAEDNHSYFRRDGVHYVPKLTVDDLII